MIPNIYQRLAVGTSECTSSLLVVWVPQLMACIRHFIGFCVKFLQSAALYVHASKASVFSALEGYVTTHNTPMANLVV